MSVESQELTDKLTPIMQSDPNSIVQPVNHFRRHDGGRSKSDEVRGRNFFAPVHEFGNSNIVTSSCGSPSYMPPVTRRSTGSVMKVSYQLYSSNSEASSVDVKPLRRSSGKRNKRSSEDSDFDIVDDESAASSSSSDAGSGFQAGSVDDDIPSMDDEVKSTSFGAVEWKPVKKLPIFPVGLFRMTQEELLDSSLSRLVGEEGWKGELRSALEATDASKSELERINVVLSYLDKREIPVVSSFFHSSLRGVRPEVIREYFSRLQDLARDIMLRC